MPLNLIGVTAGLPTGVMLGAVVLAIAVNYVVGRYQARRDRRASHGADDSD